jgi:hypothetical protein
MAFLGLLGVAVFIFWMWMLIDCMKREPPESIEKLTWALVILLGTIVGAAIYYFVRKLPRDQA